jgi:hypothetical protein
MALTSPGVEVTIIDESQYLPAAPASVPLVIFATAQDKTNASGTGIAPGTTAANAGKLYAVNSQRDLVTLFGNPFFYKTTNGTPLQGYELNEYGLLAAYSVLGTTNLIYAIRANIDLAALIGRATRPLGDPFGGTHWLDFVSSTWGIFEFNQSTGAFTRKTPLVLNDSSNSLDSRGTPLTSIGNIGDYAVTFITGAGNFTAAEEPDNYATHWKKASDNNWYQLGGPEWRTDLPVIQGTNAPSTVTLGTLVINTVSVSISVGTVNGVVSAINAANIPYVSASNVNGRLNIYTAINTPVIIGGASTAGTLSDLGLTAGTYYAPTVEFATNARQPLWRSTDTFPRPTGSVWIKTNNVNGGMNVVMRRFSTVTDTFSVLECPVASNDWTINATLDSSGGAAITAGAVYAQIGNEVPVSIFRRVNAGPSVFIGSDASPSFTNSSTFQVQVSVPGSSSLSSAYTVTLPASGTLGAADFVAAWTAQGIPYTTAAVDTTGAIVLTHTSGGVIIMNDNGASPSAVADAGFVIGTTPGAKWGPYKTLTYTGVGHTGGSGSGAQFTVVTNGYTPAFTVTTGGTGYVVGDVLTVTGANPFTPWAPDYQLRVTAAAGGSITGVVVIDGYSTPQYSVQLSEWQVLEYVANDAAPSNYPANGTYWYYSVTNQADIMTNVNGVWKGYRNVAFANNGLPQATGTPTTDPNGPIFSTSAPTTQSDGTALAYGDLWIDTSDLENYPIINRWQQVDGDDQWVLIDNTDFLTENGVLFADARWGGSNNVDPVYDPIPSISGLLTSDYVDLDAPDAINYPQGMLLFNTRRSSYNVKQFAENYFNLSNFPDSVLPPETSTWKTISGNMTSGAPYMGRKAQRAVVVQSLISTVSTNAELRDEETFFNLMACPNYPELQPTMVALNNDRNQTAYIIGDTPLRLADTASAVTSWATNTAQASSTGEEGLVTRNTYMGLYYPSAITTDLTGSEVVVPPSHMILRTMIYNDTVAYPWFAPAGQRRGIVDNATNIGYLNAQTNRFIVTKNRQQLRDVEYTNFINPIAFFQNLGILNYGNKNSFDSSSALDRTNVARLVVYLRWQLQQALRPFIFEPNDSITRSQAAAVVSTLLADVQSKRGIYDYIVVCDQTNNTPARIDRNELWVDVAIEPVKAAEFIYVPVRILNTGELAGLGQNG